VTAGLDIEIDPLVRGGRQLRDRRLAKVFGAAAFANRTCCAGLWLVAILVAAGCKAPAESRATVEAIGRPSVAVSVPGFPPSLVGVVSVEDLLRTEVKPGFADALRFEREHGLDPAGYRWLYVDVGGGVLCALDHGEWGGALWWLGPGGRERRVLATDNVRGIVVARGIATVLCGVTHLSIDEGWLLHFDCSGWRLLGRTELASSPWSFTVDAEGTIAMDLVDGESLAWRDGRLEMLAR
jgi:hypothetical protein